MIDRLPDRDRMVLLLRDREGLSWEQVADVLDEPLAAVKSGLHHARMSLREQVTRSPALGYPHERLIAEPSVERSSGGR